MNTRLVVVRCGLSLILSATLVGGCSRAPSTAPDMSSGGGSATPSFVRVPGPSAGTQSFGAIPLSLTGSVTVDGLVGGSFSVGRFSLEIPAGAFNGTGVVSIVVPDPNVLHCQLRISPDSLNAFAVPVNLIADCRDGSYADMSALTMLWDNIVIHSWQPVAGTNADSASYKVVAPLPHFSDYGVVDGKAGW